MKILYNKFILEYENARVWKNKERTKKEQNTHTQRNKK